MTSENQSFEGNYSYSYNESSSLNLDNETRESDLNFTYWENMTSNHAQNQSDPRVSNSSSEKSKTIGQTNLTAE